MGDNVEFLTMTFWSSIDAIKKFAGEGYEKARYYPALGREVSLGPGFRRSWHSENALTGQVRLPLPTRATGDRGPSAVCHCAALRYPSADSRES
jgi:hypothetical protein